MKIKILVTISVILSLNFGGNLATQATPLDVLQKSYDLKRELYKQRQKDKLPKIVAYLTTRVNKTSYVFSGSSPKGWDCSGMVRWAYKQIGITLPHSADGQGHLGKRVSIPKIGDVVVFAYPNRKDFYHAAIYLGNNLIINANREYGTTVIEPLSNFSHSQIRFIQVISQ
jgi:cell wall-associated NlpC family hydrolase